MNRPLADRMRPRRLGEIVGQDRWLGDDGTLRQMVDNGVLRSVVLWGPPGCGKTTIARALSSEVKARFIAVSAVLDGVKRLRECVAEAQSTPLDPRPTLLFVDEIHRWNKAQQDALLPHVESGTLTLVGATTENPSFELNAALRSRLQIVRLVPLEPEHVRLLLLRALEDPRGYGGDHPEVADSGLDALVRLSGGDGRRALEALERCISSLKPTQTLDDAHIARVLDRMDLRHDRSGEDHFNVLSALIKSLRGSDPDAGLYWLARLLVAGEDPVVVARRLVIFASEDVGNADPRGLQVAMAAADAVRMTGMPEARIILAQAVTWLATCPKSNAAYLGINQAMEEVQHSGPLPVPMHLRNAPTAHLRDEGYGKGYRYPHDHAYGIVDQSYLPDALQGRTFYRPTQHGAEKLIAERLAWWARKLAERNGD